VVDTRKAYRPQRRLSAVILTLAVAIQRVKDFGPAGPSPMTAVGGAVGRPGAAATEGLQRGGDGAAARRDCAPNGVSGRIRWGCPAGVVRRPHIDVADDSEYAEAANAVWMLLQISRLKGSVEHDGVTSKKHLNDW
jgi:hypothetical protein